MSDSLPFADACPDGVTGCHTVPCSDCDRLAHTHPDAHADVYADDRAYPHTDPHPDDTIIESIVTRYAPAFERLRRS